VFPKRFRHAEELARMGADVKFEDSAVRVRGVDRLTGARVQATDLRAAAALIIAGLSAEGVTKIQGLHHLERGYEDFAIKLQGLGARIQRVEPTVVRMAG
jgi:UDP-N-acetylglucosamine 1-carboxyvinyltransferase